MIKILYVHGNPNGGSFQKLSKYAAEADIGGEHVEMPKIGYTGPYCMIDSVLADAQWKDLSLEFLEKMNHYWF